MTATKVVWYGICYERLKESWTHDVKRERPILNDCNEEKEKGPINKYISLVCVDRLLIRSKHIF